MIIKHPDLPHIEGMSTLWQEAFHEPKESPETFFSTAFSPTRSMVCLDEDTVVAALYWFDCLWGDKKVAYIYAVATKETHRGQGLCTKLMAATHQELKEKGYHGAILVPAEDDLFSFYARMGYLPCCPGGIPGEKLTEEKEEKLGLTPITMAEYLFMQKIFLPTESVVHTDAAYEYLSHFGEFYKFKTGILCKIGEDIQERLPYRPKGEMTSMYLPLTEDKTLPFYFAHPLA